MRTTISIFMILLLCFSAFSQQLEKLNTSVFDWNKLQADKTEYGESRLIFKGRTNSLSYFEVHVSSLNPGEAVHTNQRHPDIEELIIVKDGNVEQRINGRKKVLGPGSVILITPGDKHGITNEGTVPASYYMLNWKVENPVDPDRSQTEGDSQYYDWNEIEYQVTKKGGKRQFMRRPTGILSELEMHVTTLNENTMSHAEHVHDPEEIILVIRGEVEESIDGTPYKVGPGSLILLMDMVPHGIKNAGKGQCEYFAFKWIK